MKLDSERQIPYDLTGNAEYENKQNRNSLIYRNQSCGCHRGVGKMSI